MNRKHLQTILLTIIFSLLATGTVASQGKATKTPAGCSSKAATPAPASIAAAAVDDANLMDINSAPPEKLITLDGIYLGLAKKIIENRPYRTKNDLITKKVIPQDAYDKISNRITARQGTTKTTAPTKSKK